MDGLSTNFLQDLTAAGYSPESIDVVVCTHLHIDHVGWNTRLVDGRWLPTFPNARYLISRAEYEHWSQQQEDALHRKVFADSVQPVWDAGLVDLVPTDHVLCPEVLLVPTPGHTPGHVSVRICSAGQQAVITGDFIHHPFQFARPEWSARIDHDSHQSVLTRREAFSRFIADNVLVIGTHFNNPSAGHVRSDSDSFRFEV
jgi:glyoxylase-like metal-dependent hydrolase (beta-lactamase superfamily II)